MSKYGSGHVDIEGIGSLLDTDLYKLTMQWAVIKSGYGDVDVTYSFTNRTPDLKIKRKGFQWLQRQVGRLGDLAVTEDELSFLRRKCPFFPTEYLDYLKDFKFHPAKQVVLEFEVEGDHTEEALEAHGAVTMKITGKWAETILYEIPLLVLMSEAYFRFTDVDWDYTGQEEKAYRKGMTLLEGGCAFSEFGTRRRRSYATHNLVMKGLLRAWNEYRPSLNQIPESQRGLLTGTSNVHFAHRFDVNPIGTVAHEWFMGIAAITNDYRNANLVGIEKWVSCFGQGVLGIALTDTFGTEQFLECFKQEKPGTGRTYAEIFTGVRQDSGNPEGFALLMKKFYDDLQTATGRTIDKKMIVFSDSLNVGLCFKYKKAADECGFATSFGVGTDFTNDFHAKSQPNKKSIPLNIVIKLSSAAGNPAIKISDNAGKNTGDKDTVEKVKKEIHYEDEKWWNDGGNVDERFRWGKGQQ